MPVEARWIQIIVASDLAACRENNSTISARHGWDVAAIYRDQGINGAKGRDKRRGLDRLMHDQQSCCKLRRSSSEISWDRSVSRPCGGR